MELDSELGVLETSEVEAALSRNFEAIRDCYQHAGKAQRYAGGRVLLRFMVNGDGSADDVLVVESTLGNYDVERCVVGIGRRSRSPRPPERKPPPSSTRSSSAPAISWPCWTSTASRSSATSPASSRSWPRAAASPRRRPTSSSTSSRTVPVAPWASRPTSPRRGRRRLRRADDPALEDVGRSSWPRDARHLQHPADARVGGAPPPRPPEAPLGVR